MILRDEFGHIWPLAIIPPLPAAIAWRIAYQTRKGANGKNYNNRVGAAWRHEKGEGFTIFLDAIPLDGRIVVFPVSEKQE